MEPECLQLCTMEPGNASNEAECWRDGGTSDLDEHEGFARSCSSGSSGSCNKQHCKTELIGQCFIKNGDNVNC